MSIQQQAYRKRENFPVASWLLPSHARGPILALYDFARGADNIADHPDMEAEDKFAALEALQSALENHYRNQMPPWAIAYYEVTHRLGLNVKHGNQLLQAFIQDTQKHRYQTLEELDDYCTISAAPVGRAVLEICGEREADLAASDALCGVLQLLNHIQGIKNDYMNLQRIYLPGEWLESESVSEADLAADGMSDGLRQVVSRLLNVCDERLMLVHALPTTINSARLRAEISWILKGAKKLSARLRHQDVLDQKVVLSKREALSCLLYALPMLWNRR